MELDRETLAVIEKFYQIHEEMENYKRPVDWIERAMRVLSGEFHNRRQSVPTIIKNKGD